MNAIERAKAMLAAQKAAKKHKTALPAKSAPAALPAVAAAMPLAAKPAAMSVPAPDSFALKKAPADYPAIERALRDEKVLYVKMTFDLKASSPAMTMPAAAAEVARQHGALFPRLSASNSLCYHNLRNWVNGCHDKPGLRDPATGKIDYTRGDVLLRNYGHSRERYGDDRFWRALSSAFLNAGQGKLAKIYRELTRKWLQDFPGITLPSLQQVRYYIKQNYPKRAQELTRRGETHYLQKFRNYIERDPDTIRPNEAWVADTQECDFMIRVDDGTGKYKATRPWIMVIMDIKSEHVVSCQLGVEAINNIVIRNGFAEAIAKFGRPMIFLTDNGSDYDKLGFTEPVTFTPNVANSDVYEHCILKELDIEHRNAAPYNARAKFVERFFREMAEYARHARGYVGNCPANRPATADVWTREENCAHLMNAAEACAFINDAIAAYHRKPSPASKYLNGLSPAQAFSPEMRTTRAALSYEEYYRAFLMPHTAPRVVDSRGPSVKVDNTRYVAYGPRKTSLWQYDGKPVMVKFDIISKEYCYLFSLEGKFICEAAKQEKVAYFATTESQRQLLADQLQAIRAEQKALNTFVWSETKGFHRLDIDTIFGLPPDAFSQRAKLHELDRRTSVKGDTHNPAIYLAAAPEIKGDLVYSNNNVLPATQKRNIELEQDVERRLLSSTPAPVQPIDEFETTEDKPQGVHIDENDL